MSALVQEELDRLAGCLARAVRASDSLLIAAEIVTACGVTADSCGRYAIATAGARHDSATVETRYHTEVDAAVAELRAILRADADHAIADMLDTLAAEAERGPITAEMLRTMAQVRRGK